MRLGEVRDAAKETERNGKGRLVKWRRRFAGHSQGSSGVAEEL